MIMRSTLASPINILVRAAAICRIHCLGRSGIWWEVLFLRLIALRYVGRELRERSRRIAGERISIPSVIICLNMVIDIG